MAELAQIKTKHDNMVKILHSDVNKIQEKQQLEKNKNKNNNTITKVLQFQWNFNCNDDDETRTIVKKVISCLN